MRGSGRELIVRRASGAALIDLGEEPPLLVSGAEPAESSILKRAVSWRWLAGTVLTGVTSILLMGVALVAALNNPKEFATLPAAAMAALTPPDAVVFGQKGDRIRPIQEPVASRQVMQVSTVTRQGEKDLIKQRPFAKISTTLTGPTDQLAKQIPAFDMLRIFGEGAAADRRRRARASALDDQFYGAKIDGEVSVTISDFPVGVGRPRTVGGPFDHRDRADRARRFATSKSAATVAPLVYIDAGPAAPDPRSLGVRIEIENVSSIAKSVGGPVDGAISEKVVNVAQAADLGPLLQQNGIAGADAAKIVAALAPMVDVAHLRSGQKVRLAFALPMTARHRG